MEFLDGKVTARPNTFGDPFEPALRAQWVYVAITRRWWNLDAIVYRSRANSAHFAFFTDDGFAVGAARSSAPISSPTSC